MLIRGSDKKTATTYALVYRPQNDPLINDENASSQIFTEVSGPSLRSYRSKTQNRESLEKNYDFANEVRQNEGEAAEYGIFFDDSSYDYMQHLRQWKDPSAGGVTIEAAKDRSDNKGKRRLLDALQVTSLDDEKIRLAELGTNDWHAYERQQDVPDSLARFNPDMDPRLREVLEALEDEEFVDDEDEIFTELVGEGPEEMEEVAWKTGGYAGNTKTPNVQALEQSSGSDLVSNTSQLSLDRLVISDDEGVVLSAVSNGFNEDNGGAHLPETSSGITTSSTMLQVRRKKRKGALTSSTGFSMTSSSLARTEAMSTLDSRFDRILDSYMESIDESDEKFDDNMSQTTEMTSNTRASHLRLSGKKALDSERSEGPSQLQSLQFQVAMDDFLEHPATKSRGGQRSKNKNSRSGAMRRRGMEQLDEIRQGLGPARLKQSHTVTQHV